MAKNIIFIDTETTGLIAAKGANLSSQPYVIEVSAILTDNKLNTLEEFNTLVNPGVSIPDFITKITGIDNYAIRDAPSFNQIRKPLSKIIKSADLMVAQNLRFDYDMLAIEYRRCNREFKPPKNLFCTVEQSLHFKGFRLKSTELYELAENSLIQGIHRARADVVAMIEYYKFIITSPIPKHLQRRKKCAGSI